MPQTTFVVPVTLAHLERALPLKYTERLVETCILAQAAKEVVPGFKYVGLDTLVTEQPGGVYYYAPDSKAERIMKLFDSNKEGALEELQSLLPTTVTFTKQ